VSCSARGTEAPVCKTSADINHGKCARAGEERGRLGASLGPGTEQFVMINVRELDRTLKASASEREHVDSAGRGRR